VSQVTADSVLALARIAAERLMEDACTITRRSGQSTNPDTGVVNFSYTVIYTGKCKVMRRGPRGASNRPVNLGEAFELLSFVEVSIPISSTVALADDIVTVTASVNDADLVNRAFHVRGYEHRSFASARRLQCVESTG
jgi:hypothetical protein